MVFQRIRKWLAAPFEFTAIPVSVLTVVVYGAVFAAVLSTDQLYNVPKNTKGLDVDRAYADLHQITARPHPYLSHANDDVHAYLLSQLEPVAAAQAYVHLSDDLTSNASWVVGGHGVYFEGTNILVKVDGAEAGADGVLFSVHYDSVSTAPGATDDGMGVVTLLELVRYFAVPENRPRRTAVFFFNNGEEDGLNGAYVYWKHPWSNLTSSFINLEGAASGGRPLLFRSTSLAPTRAYASKAISHLQADVLTADAYKRGVIRSYTDYQVYAAGLKGTLEPMAGLDIAFYKNRAYYHTPRDSIAGMGYNEGRKALWAMMESARGAGLALLNDDDTVSANAEPAVYFDLFRTKLVVFPLRSLFIANVAFLVIGPIVILILLGMVLLAFAKTPQEHAAEEQVQHDKWAKTKIVLRQAFGWSRFWIALVVGIAAHVGLVAGFVHLNPYVVHAHPFLVLTTYLSLSFLAITAPLHLFQHFIPASPSSEKLAVLLEHYLLTWAFLVFSTVEIQKYQIAGLYWITVWNVGALIASSVALTESVVRGTKAGVDGRKAGLDLTVESDYDETNGSGSRFVPGVLYEAPAHDVANGRDEELGGEAEGEPVETEATEITPLMHQHRPDGADSAADLKYQEHGWWIAQLLVSVPMVAVLVFQLELLQLQALMNTLVDGSSPLTVYGSLSALSMLVFIPLAPFAHKVSRWLTVVATVVFAVSLTISWTVFPFTPEKPFKVYFQQRVEIGAPTIATPSSYPALVTNADYPGTGSADSAASHSVRAITTLTGLEGYVDHLAMREMPSSRNKGTLCYLDTVLKPGLRVCEWESDLLPSPGGDVTSGRDLEWLEVKTERLNATRAVIKLKGTNTRGCRLYFDKPITSYAILDGDAAGGELLPGYEMPDGGVNELRLWTRTWGKPFVVEFGWDGTEVTDVAMRGRAACEWAEYASASAGGSSPAAHSALIPALEEVRAFLPLWALPSKATDGLVETWTRFEV